jgi:aminopeptidase C
MSASHTFNKIPAKPTFGTFQNQLDSSDYLTLKKQRYLKYNKDPKYINTYDYYYLNKDKTISLLKQINTNNLNYNLISKENLNNVITLIDNNGQINPYINPDGKPFYKYYKIDPLGQLFGLSQCGVNNYVNYMEYRCL